MIVRSAILSLTLLSACSTNTQIEWPTGELPLLPSPVPVMDHTQVLQIFQDHCLAQDFDLGTLEQTAATFGLTTQSKSDVLTTRSFKARGSKVGHDYAVEFKVHTGPIFISFVEGADPTGAPARIHRCSIKAFVPPITDAEKSEIETTIEDGLTPQSQSLTYQSFAPHYQVTANDVTVKHRLPERTKAMLQAGHPQCASAERCFFGKMRPMEISLEVVVERIK